MAKLSKDGTYVTVEKRDTLSQIALTYLGSASKYKQLAAINNISNPNLIYVGQKIMLTSSGSSSSSNSSSSNAATITHFGLQSDADNTLFATWSWGKQTQTASYKVQWTYDTGDGVWFVGNNSSITVDDDDPDSSRQSTYSIPKNAKRVRFKVKPISETYQKNKKETVHWSANWSKVKTHTVAEEPPGKPSTPTVVIENYKLTASLDNINLEATGIQFEVVKNNSATVFRTGKASIVTSHASYSCNVDAGGEYKVRCRAYRGGLYSEWSDYSANTETIPAASSGITTIRAGSETSVYLEWSKVTTAKSYDIEYSTKKKYFDSSDETIMKSGVENTHFEITGLESGNEYFFRVRAVNEKGESAWTAIKSVVIGKAPSAPTTWSSTTTAITGEELILYWVHNAEDGSSETYADLELYIDGMKETHTIQNSSDEDEKDKTSFYVIDTSSFIEGTTILWRVRTAGITKTYGDWSIQRTIDIYAPVTLELGLMDQAGNSIETLTGFPCKLHAIASPKTQIPIGYHVSVVSNEVYDTVDNMGNEITVNQGEEVYSKYFDIMSDLHVEFSASNIDLENNVSYTVQVTVSMNSGLTAENSLEFTVNWVDVEYLPNAEISLDPDTLTAYVRPYCEDSKLVKYQVNRSGRVYTVTTTAIDSAWGEVVPGAKTTTGELVYLGVTPEDVEIYFCEVEEKASFDEVLLSVYRREFDGSFTELAVDLDGAKSTTITDPHPALDYARYRIVAKAKDTGAISYYDPPGHPVGGTAVVIQWDEDWSTFDTTEESELEQPPWSGSMLKLPYNIDVSDDHKPDVVLAEYIGREHPVSYYGTQLGHSSTWNMEIDKSDKETLYALRRLSRWTGDVYVREPSGSGYWANITVSFSQKHKVLTIPITLSVKRVEGGA